MKTQLLNHLATRRVISVPYLLGSPQSLGRTATRGLKSVVLCGALLLAATHPLRAQVTLVTTITNPTPASVDYFGWSLAVLDDQRILIGAPYDDTAGANAGAAYLFSASGTLLATYTNPVAPAANSYFGYSVATLGGNQVLVGAIMADAGAANAGAACLFDTNGTLLTTFTNPTPSASDYFGASLTAVGSDRVLIGAYRDDTGASDAGAAYLFSTNGTLLLSITNILLSAQEFGYSVAALGNDCLILGARTLSAGTIVAAGGVLLFQTNGTLLTTISNPTPVLSDYFGACVAAVGGDKVLIGAPSDDTGAQDAGAAYLYNTNGTLLITFTNPTPAYLDSFGIAVAAVGADKLLIGAHQDDSSSTDAGIAYLYSTAGTLLHAITNPTPANLDSFGIAVAAGSGFVVIGASSDDTGAQDAGAAYLYTLPTPGAPWLSILRTPPTTVAVSWPSPSTGWNLQQNTNSVSSQNWSNVTSGIQDDGTNKSLLLAPPTGNRFYRLHKP